MVVIAALIGAGGLGLTVYVALGRLDIGGAVIGGTGIVILAIVLGGVIGVTTVYKLNKLAQLST